jgi:hypothetical protein
MDFNHHIREAPVNLLWGWIPKLFLSDLRTPDSLFD